jgi:hypothetical protein
MTVVSFSMKPLRPTCTIAVSAASLFGQTVSFGLVLVLVLLAGCSHRPVQGGRTSSSQIKSQALSAGAAAQLAAKLANDECERRFKRRPFSAERYDAVLENGVYRWGRLDVGAPGGYSAKVTFHEDGSRPKVEVYLSADYRDVRPR